MLSSSIFFLLFFIQLWPVWRQSGRIIYARSNFAHPIWFRSSKEDLDHIVQNQPGCDLDGVVRFWPNTQDPEASQCARIIKPGSGWMQAAHCSFSLSNSVLFFHRQPGSYCAKPAQIWFGSGWLCQVLAKWVRSGSKAREHKSSGLVLANASNPVPMRYELDPACLPGSLTLWYFQMQHLSVMMVTNQSRAARVFKLLGGYQVTCHAMPSCALPNSRAAPGVAHISSMTAKFLQSSQRLAPTQHRNVLLVYVALNYLIKIQMTKMSVWTQSQRTVSLQLIMTLALKKKQLFFLFFFLSLSLGCCSICWFVCFLYSVIISLR